MYLGRAVWQKKPMPVSKSVLSRMAARPQLRNNAHPTGERDDLHVNWWRGTRGSRPKIRYISFDNRKRSRRTLEHGKTRTGLALRVFHLRDLTAQLTGWVISGLQAKLTLHSAQASPLCCVVRSIVRPTNSTRSPTRSDGVTDSMEVLDRLHREKNNAIVRL